MTYKGFRIDRKFNIFGLKNELLAEKTGNIELAKEYVDRYIEEHKNAGKEKREKKEITK